MIPRPFEPRPSEQGAALLAVLLLVAVMASLSAIALEKMTLAARTAGNAAALNQARAYATGAETFALLRIADLSRASPDRTTLAGGWHGNPIRVPLPTGVATAIVTDGGNCFNMNGVVRPADAYGAPGVPGAPAAPAPDPVRVPDPSGIRQFVALLQAVGVPTNEAAAIADGLADWIDTDASPGPAGAEDGSYADLPVPYRTPNRLVTDASELRAVAGVTPAAFAAVAPFLCALPEAAPSSINVNTLLPEQAPLLAMLLPGQLGVDDARAVIARRPAAGYADGDAFWDDPSLRALALAPDVRAQAVAKTRWFRLRLDVELDGAQMSEVALIDAGAEPARLVSRNWGQD